MYESILAFSLNAFSGLLVAILTLTIFHLTFAPKILFSRNIRLFFPATDRRPHYSIRFIRLGKIDLVDVTVSCRLTVTDIAKNGKGLREYYQIETSSKHILLLKR